MFGHTMHKIALYFLVSTNVPSNHAFFSRPSNVPPTTDRADTTQSFTATHSEMTVQALFMVTARFLNSRPLPESQTIPEDGSAAPEDMFLLHYGRRVSSMAYTQAVLEIVRANSDTDHQQDTKHDPTYHFDNEQFGQSNNRLKETRRSVYVAAMAGDYAHARVLTGRYLHTMQDFYSRSNWIEMGNTQPHEGLGQEGVSEGEVAGPNMATCLDCVSTPQTECHLNIIPAINEQRLLTSGYYGHENIRGNHGIIKPVGKCSHGGPADTNANQTPRGGINKDSSRSDLSPHYHLHRVATRMALNATLDFFERLRGVLSEEKFSSYLAIQPTGRQSLTIVMDTTKSMRNYIEAAQQRSMVLIQRMNQTGLAKTTNYVLVPFNDPSVGPFIRTTDAERFKQEVNLLTPGHGGENGGDEPEMSMSAIIMAAEQSDPRCPIFVFTDAAPKDGHRYTEAAAILAQKQQPVIIFTVSKERLYRDLAAVSGGRVLTPSADAADIFKLSGVMSPELHGNSSLLVSLRDVREAKKTLELHVDSRVDKIDVLVGHESRAPSLTVEPPPFNSRPRRSLPMYNCQELVVNTTTAKLCRIDKPRPGVWNIEIDGPEAGWFAEIRGESTFDVICSFEYPLDDDSSFSELINNPLSGEKLQLTVRSTCRKCRLENARFLLSDGTVLTTFPLKATQNPDVYHANIAIPTEPFYIEVVGVGEDGSPFQRLQPTQITPTYTELTFTSGDSIAQEMPLGTRKNIEFIIRNHGSEAATFQMNVNDVAGLVDSFSPKAEFSLGSNQTMEATVTLAVPQDATLIGQLVNLVVTVSASGTDGTGSHNFFRKTIFILSDAPADTHPPSCEIIWSTFSAVCQPNISASSIMCQNSTWEAAMKFTETGSGIDGIFARTSGVNDTVNFTVTEKIVSVDEMTNKTVVSATASGTCCARSNTFTVVDGVGLMGQCVLRQPDQKPIKVKAAGYLWAVLGPVLGCLVVGALIFYYCSYRQRPIESGRKPELEESIKSDMPLLDEATALPTVSADDEDTIIAARQQRTRAEQLPRGHFTLTVQDRTDPKSLNRSNLFVK